MRVLVVFVFLMGLFNCNTVPTKENLDKILNSNKVTVNLMTSRGGISGYASPRTKSKDKFEIIGKLELKNDFNTSGGYGYLSSFEKFEEIFNNIENYIEVFRKVKFPVNILCETN